jgi:hypothetical protein
MPDGWTRRVKRKTNADRVQEWFARFPGKCFCSDCVIKEIGDVDKAIVATTTSRIVGNRLGARYRARCSLCGEIKRITVMNRSL